MAKSEELATTDIDTQVSVRLSKQAEDVLIDRIARTQQATVLGIDDAKFQQIAARTFCRRDRIDLSEDSCNKESYTKTASEAKPCRIRASPPPRM